MTKLDSVLKSRDITFLTKVPIVKTMIFPVVMNGYESWTIKKPESESKVAQSCPPLFDPMDYSPPGSSVHGILQARVLKWVAISFSRDLPDPGIKPRSPTLRADTLTSEPPGNADELMLSNCGAREDF